MTLADGNEETRARIEADGIDGTRERAHERYVRPLRRTERSASGTDVYHSKWDGLVVTDGRRGDALLDARRIAQRTQPCR